MTFNSTAAAEENQNERIDEKNDLKAHSHLKSIFQRILLGFGISSSRGSTRGRGDK